jgi:hypothetical protein
VEAGALGDVSVLECFACDQGCIGSPLFAGDPFVAARRWDAAGLISGEGAAALPRKKGFAPRPGLRLDPDMTQAMAKLAAIDSLARTLPGRDCTACGAPGCPAFAEDVVLGRAAVGDCPHLPAAAQREPQRRWRDPQ